MQAYFLNQNIIILFFLLSFFIFYNALIFYKHRKVRDKIKTRIHVNGTRGKSSVTRLIAAGLREAGIKTLAKTTGTAANTIYPDGVDRPIPRRHEKGNIIEQTYVLKEAVNVQAEAAVIECMALKPHLQRVSEEKLINSTIGVITNIRADHLDIMGPTARDVVNAIFWTIPRNAVLITAEKEYLDLMKERARKLNTKVISAAEPETITDEMMKGFTYLEHRENVALAICACKQLGISQDVALKGMHKCEPDPGVLRTFKIHKEDKYIEFINALATNDPVSLMIIWQRMLKKITKDQLKIILINCRKDRHSRSQQLAELICHEFPNCCILVGEATNRVAGSLSKCSISKDRIINMGITSPEAVFEKVLSLTQKNSVVFAIGNIADRHGLGRGLAEYFKERSKKN